MKISLANRKHTYCFTAIQIKQINGTSLALEELLRFGHDLCNETLEIVLLFEYVSRQIEEYLIAPVFLHGQLEQLRVLYADTAEREVSMTIDTLDKIRCAIVLISVSIARGADYNCVQDNYNIVL